MKRVMPRRLVIFGGLAGLILGLLIVVGFLAVAHLQGHRSEGEADAIAAAERQIAETAEEPAGEAQASPSSTDASAQEPPFPYTTWGLVGRIAAAQLEAGDEDGSRRTMALIPREEGAATRIYRTHLDKVYNDLLTATLQNRWVFSPHAERPTSPEARLKQAEAIAEKFSMGVPRAGAWLRIANWIARRPKVGESAGKDARSYVDKSAAEIMKVKDYLSDAGRLSHAWKGVGGGLMLCWPLGLTVLGTLGGEVLRKAFETFAEGVGESAAGWLGGHRHAAEAGIAADGPADSAD